LAIRPPAPRAGQRHLLWRTVDCRVYRKELKRPGDETRQFLDLLFSNVTPST
jgi:hypothetical protein